MSRKASRPCLVLLALAGLIGMHEPAAAQESRPCGPPAGRLSCTVGTGLTAITRSQRPTECRFRPRRGPVQHYTGVVRGFSLDLGTVRSTTTMVWRVYGPYARAPLGVLTGQYRGAGTALSGLRGNTATLLPLPLQGNRGINVAIGVTALDLTLVPPGRRR